MIALLLAQPIDQANTGDQFAGFALLILAVLAILIFCALLEYRAPR